MGILFLHEHQPHYHRLHHVSDRGDGPKEQIHLKADADIGDLEGAGRSQSVEWRAHVTVRVGRKEARGDFFFV